MPNPNLPSVELGASTFDLRCIRSCLRLLSLLLFLAHGFWRGSLRINSSLLFRHAVTVTFVLKMLVGILIVPGECKDTNFFGRGPGRCCWSGLRCRGLPFSPSMS